jgi:phage baseplate assembly protein W
MIQDENLLYQAALKIILTDRGSNPYNKWYGTQIRSRIGSKALAGVAAVISEDVRQALVNYQGLQEKQAFYQKVSYKERLYTVLAVDVKPHAQDQTTFLIEVVVQNASNETVNLTTIFTVPSVIAFLGSNGLMLGATAAGIGTDSLVVGAKSPMKRES